MKKRILSLVLAVVMVLCLVPAISLVSFAAAEDYSVLPDDTNKQHFVDVMAAYADANAPTAAVINEKLTGYLALNKVMTVEEQAKLIADSIQLFYYEDGAYEENVEIITQYLTEKNPIGTKEGEYDHAHALEQLLIYVDGDPAQGWRAWGSRNSANHVAFKAINSSAPTTVDANTAATYADIIYSAGVWVVGVENVEATQEAYIKDAVQKIIDDGNITSFSRNYQGGDPIFTPLASTLHFRTTIDKGGATAVQHSSNNQGFWTYISAALEQINKQMNYGAHKVADFYLNFTDVKLGEGVDADAEKAKLKAILDYYFAPGKGNYGYYEDLWYDDGHLVYFVDTSNLDNPYAKTENSKYEEGTRTALTPSHFARFIQTAGDESGNVYSNPNTANLRSHVKIVGGYEIGRYFTIGTDFVNNNAGIILKTEVNTDGYLRIYHNNVNNAYYCSHSWGMSKHAGIFVGLNYSYEQTYDLLTQHVGNASTNQMYTDYNYYLDNGMKSVANEDGYFGGYTTQLNLRLDPTYWTNENYPQFDTCTSSATNKVNLYGSQVGSFLSGPSMDGGNTGPQMSGGLIKIGAKYDATLGAAVTMTGRVITGANNSGAAVGGDNSIVLGSPMSISTAAGFIDPYSKVAQLRYLNVNGTSATYDRQYFEVSNENVFYPCSTNTNLSLVTNTGFVVSQMVQMQDKLMSNFRAYDVALTNEQLAQNAFADLAYEKGIDLTKFNTLSDINKNLVWATLYGADLDATTEADIDKVIDDVINIKFYNSDYSEYEHLWYDDGHLVAFVDLMNITEDQRTTSTLFGDQHVAIKDTFRLLTGYSNVKVNSADPARAYVRITGGQKAGDWFMIVTNNKNNNSFYTFPTVEGGFTDFGDPTTYLSGNKTGIMVAQSYTDAEVVKPFTKTAAQLVGDSYILPAANGGNSFTADTAIYIKVPTTLTYSHANYFGTNEFVRSTENTDMFQDSNMTPYNKTDLYNMFTAGMFSNDQIRFSFGYNARYSQLNVANDLDCSFHLSSIIDYIDSNTFNTSLKALVNNATEGHKLLSRTADAPKAYEATDGYPSYGASADMDTAMVFATAESYYYYVRMYDVALTDAQIMQNHFADLMYYNRIDTAKYDALTDADKTALWAWATDIQLSDATAKADIEAKIDAMAEDNTSIINFKGFQARVSKNVGVRSVFYLDQSAIADAGFTVKAYGAIAGTAVDGADFDNFTISYDATNGVTVSSNAKMTASTDDDFKLIADVEKEFILGSAENLNNYTMFAYTVDFIENGTIANDGTVSAGAINHISDEKDTEMFFRAFAVVEHRGVIYTVYADGASANYDNTSVSLTEISEYYAAYNNGEFANNACIKAVVGTTNDEE